MKRIATLGPIGYLPASGTWATLVTLFIIYLLHLVHISWSAYCALTLVLALMGFYVIKITLGQFKHHDPGEIVIDELVGCLITFMFVPFTLYTALIGFALFRLLDITKIFGISWLEHQGNSMGVLLDDIGAGLLSNLILHILIRALGLI